MEPLSIIIDLIIHIDEHLTSLVQQYGFWIYFILFLIIFCETGLVIAPFLPGDSLIFAAGALAAIGAMDIAVLFIVLSTAAILGDTVNYWIGNRVGSRILQKEKIPFVKKKHIQRAKDFYEKHGGKTIVIARFIPIMRTFAPFVAGVGDMQYKRFIVFNVVGAFMWVSLFLTLGFAFGNLPFVRDNFAMLVVAIIIISFMPFLFELVRSIFKIRRGCGDATPKNSGGPLDEPQAKQSGK